MDRRVILISTHKSFMINAMIKNLTGESFEVIQMEPDIRAFDSLDDPPVRMLVYLDKDTEAVTVFLNSLKERLKDSENRMSIFLAGSESELDIIKEKISPDIVNDYMKRPLNVSELAEKWNKMLAQKESKPGRRRILVVDDDGIMLRTLKLWLSDKYQVYMANSGANALSLLEKKEVDLVLMDYEMPVESGPMVLRRMRSEEATKNIPVMFLTAKNDRESMESVKALKPEKYLLKTMSPEVLQRHIDNFFDSLDH